MTLRTRLMRRSALVKVPSFSEEGRARQEDMGVVRRLVQEEVVDDDAFHRGKAGRDMLGVGVGLEDVLALDVEALEGAVDGGVEHVGDAQARLVVELDAPELLEDVARRVVGDVAIARQFVRERAHVAGALHIVLAAQRVHADAGTADIAGRHGEVGDRHDGGRALAVLGDAEAVIDRAIAAGGIEPGRAARSAPAGTPVSFSTASGLCCGSATKAAQSSNSDQSQRSRMKASSNRPSVTMTWASAVSDRRRWCRASAAGDRSPRHAASATRSMRRGSMTISLAPCRSRFFRREAKTGWPSVGLAPMMTTTSVCSTLSKFCVPAEVPKAWPRP